MSRPGCSVSAIRSAASTRSSSVSGRAHRCAKRVRFRRALIEQDYRGSASGGTSAWPPDVARVTPPAGTRPGRSSAAYPAGRGLLLPPVVLVPSRRRDVGHHVVGPARQVGQRPARLLAEVVLLLGILEHVEAVVLVVPLPRLELERPLHHPPVA